MGTSKDKESVSYIFKLSLISISAALYAVAIAVTSPIPTPWGVGNFRPGVLIPAFFAVVYGPTVGGFGAAIGTFIGDFALAMFGLTNPLLSLVAGVPGNFVGFYLMGWLARKYTSWSAFVINSFVSLTVGNLIAALGVVGYFSTVGLSPFITPLSIDLKIGLVFGFMLFWVATMIPFVVPLMPPLLRAVQPILKSNTRNSVVRELKWGEPGSNLKSTIAVSAILAALYVIVVFTPLGNVIFSETLFAAFWVETLLLIAAAIILAYGLVATVLIRRKKLHNS